MAELIIEDREELIFSPTGQNPTLRIGYFLKPSSFTSTEAEQEQPPLPLSSASSSSAPKKWPLKVSFNCWRNPLKDWKSWVNRMHSQHQTLWKVTGIHDSILNSTYTIKRDDDLVLGIAEKWCPETKSFIFPWGEATVTLEDMMVLGGYSVLGHSVSTPIQTLELIQIKEKLLKARLEIARAKSRKASQHVWMVKFMNSGSEIEHEAFLSLWLSRFVFPQSSLDTIGKHVFPIAIHLARGTKLALAPAVLATIYRDLSLLKQSIVVSNKFRSTKLTIWAPLQLVQVWIWERFPKLRPMPKLIEVNEPKMAKWDNVKKVNIKNVSLAMDLAGENFNWRPYAVAMNEKSVQENLCNEVDGWVLVDEFVEWWPNASFVSHGFARDLYNERDGWVLVDYAIDVELESFVRCVRVSELVGLDCAEQYLPHRVAMQFGLDQDIPGRVVRSGAAPDKAWEYYNRPIKEDGLYVPMNFFESGVTIQYLEWWNGSNHARQDAIPLVVKEENENLKRTPLSNKNVDKDAPVPPGTEDGLRGKEIAREVQNIDRKPLIGTKFRRVSFSSAVHETVKMKESPMAHFPQQDAINPFLKEEDGSSSRGLKRTPPSPTVAEDDVFAHPSLPPKCIAVEPMDSGDDNRPIGIENLRMVNSGSNNGKPAIVTQLRRVSSSAADSRGFEKSLLTVQHVEKIANSGARTLMEVEKSVKTKPVIESMEMKRKVRTSFNTVSDSMMTCWTNEGPELEIEARIRRLETVVAQLKIAKNHKRSA